MRSGGLVRPPSALVPATDLHQQRGQATASAIIAPASSSPLTRRCASNPRAARRRSDDSGPYTTRARPATRPARSASSAASPHHEGRSRRGRRPQPAHHRRRARSPPHPHPRLRRPGRCNRARARAPSGSLPPTANPAHRHRTALPAPLQRRQRQIRRQPAPAVEHPLPRSGPVARAGDGVAERIARRPPPHLHPVARRAQHQHEAVYVVRGDRRPPHRPAQLHPRRERALPRRPSPSPPATAPAPPSRPRAPSRSTRSGARSPAPPRAAGCSRAAARSAGQSSCRTSTTAMWMWSSACRTATHRGPPTSPFSAIPAPCSNSRAICAHSPSVRARSAAATRAEQCHTYPRLPAPERRRRQPGSDRRRLQRGDQRPQHEPTVRGDGRAARPRPGRPRRRSPAGSTCSCARPGPSR